MPKNPVSNQTEQLNEKDGKEKPETELLDFNKPNFEFKPNEHHDWRQKGPYLVCKSCELQHATYIGMDKLLIGLNEKGQPLFKKR